MANEYENIPELSSIYDREMRRRKINEMLMQQAVQPHQTQVISGRAVPLGLEGGLFKIAQAMLAKRGMDKSDTALQDIGQRYNQGQQSAVQDVMKTMQGAPAAPYQLSPDEQFDNEQIPGLMNAEVKPDLEAAAMKVVTDPYLSKNQGAQSVLSAMLRAKGYGGQGRGNYSSVDHISVDGKVVPVIVDTRGEPGKNIYMLDGSPISPELVAASKIVSPSDPKVKGLEAREKEQAISDVKLAMEPQIASATEAAESEEKRKFNMSGINATIDLADSLLSGEETGTKPTSSLLGQGYDYVASIVGKSPAGADEATQLKAIGGALTAKMPRMEGPQSDKDTLLYREMAAQVGDAGIPISQRRAALKTVKDLWAKYERLDGEAPKAETPKVEDFMKSLDAELFGN